MLETCPLAGLLSVLLGNRLLVDDLEMLENADDRWKKRLRGALNSQCAVP